MSALHVKLLHRKIIDMNNFDKVNPYKIKTLMHYYAIRIDTFIRKQEEKSLKTSEALNEIYNELHSKNCVVRGKIQC